MIISFDVDLQDPLQLDLARWYEKGPEKAKEATMLGNFVMTNGIEKFYKTFNETNIVEVKEREWHQKMNIAVASANATNKTQVKHMRDKVSELEAQLHSMQTTFDFELERRSTSYKDQVRDLQSTLTSMVKDSQVEQLRITVAEREAELKVLKSSNHMKGLTGEKVIMRYLEHNFPEYTINHTAPKSAKADIHMTNTDNEVIIIESKYKERITAGDVEKFYRDVSEVSKAQKCVGGVFESVVNKSIPNKGSLCFEQRGGIPVMFLAFASECELQEQMRLYLKLFIDVASRFKAADNESSDDDTLNQIAPYFGIINKNKEKLVAIRENCVAPMERMLKEVADNNQKLLMMVEVILHKHGKCPVRKIVCKDCGQEFTRVGDLTRHAKKHRKE
eukprot:gene19561-26243_t